MRFKIIQESPSASDSEKSLNEKMLYKRTSVEFLFMHKTILLLLMSTHAKTLENADFDEAKNRAN